MMNKIKLIISIMLIFEMISCKQTVQNKCIFEINSKWTFIEKGLHSINNYAEIELKKDNQLLIYSEIEGQIGPFVYSIVDDTISFNNAAFEIIPQKQNSFILKGLNEEFLLFKISSTEEGVNSKQFNPFYIRMCYFLTTLNYISTDEAIEYLSSLTEYRTDAFPEESLYKEK